MVSRYQTIAKQTLSSYNPDIFKWLWSLISFTVLVWSLKVLFYFLSLAPMVNMLADSLLVLLVYFIAIVQWRNPSLFHIHQLTTQPEPRHNHAYVRSSKPSSDGLLDPETQASILHLVQVQVRELALYRNSELTLASLAEQVGVSVHHLSETLNQYAGKNFNLFINEYRVSEVCQQLKQEKDRKLIDLALDAGFSSKSSFNAIFKKLTGKTPSLYRRQTNLL
jgi:AraC-like DNA-binding protein